MNIQFFFKKFENMQCLRSQQTEMNKNNPEFSKIG